MNRVLSRHEVLTLAEAADFLRLKKPLLEALAQKGEVPARKAGGEWRFLRAALEEWLRGQPGSHAAFL